MIHNESFYQDLVQKANTVILEFDKDGYITFVNQFGASFFEYEVDELLGQHILGTIVPMAESSGRDLEFLMQDILDHPERYAHNENENITKTGRRVWAVWSNTPRFDAEGRITGILAIANDTTRQKEAEAAIHRQNEYLAALHETTLGLMSRLEVEDLLKAIIGRASQLLETEHGSIYLVDNETEKLVLHVGIGLFEPLVGLPLEQGQSMPGQVWQTGKPLMVTDYATWPNRPTYSFASDLRAGMGVPLTRQVEDNNNPCVIGVLGLGYDVHSTKLFVPADVDLLTRFAELASIALDNARLYSQAQQARTMAETANETKSAFLANVSHELRTPLTSILGFAKIIEKRLRTIFRAIEEPTERQTRAMQQVQQNINIITAEGERLTALINDVLDLAKIEAGRIEWHMQPLEVSELVERAIVATSSLFEQKNLPLRQEIAPGLPKIIGDKDRLVQVLINLLSNAVKFTHSGQVICQAVSSDNQVVISVIDTGLGIRLAEQAQVFDKFKQVGDTLTDKPQGTGLGLPICKEIILNHEGSIWVESELGRGSTFSFSLPTLIPSSTSSIADAWIKKLDIDLLLKQVEESHHIKPKASTQKTVLVVDDEAHIRELLRQELMGRHYKVIEAKDGLDALSKIKENRPDLIILDVMMPRMNGFDVVSLLKDDPLTANIPLIILSIVEEEGRGYRLGVDRFFHKPLDIQKILTETEILLRQGHSKKKVLLVDENPVTSKQLKDVLLMQGYQVAQLFDEQAMRREAIEFQPDMIILNSAHSDDLFEIASTLRFEKGLENVMLFFFQEAS